MSFLGFGNKNSYDVLVRCENCKLTGNTKIPKGMDSDDYINNKPCGNCGCLTLKKIGGNGK